MRPTATWIGPYQVLALLGRGGMGAVYRCRHPTGVEVAVKQLTAGGRASSRQLERFARELRALQRLDHDNVLKVLDAGQGPDGSPWFVTPLLAGVPLAERLRHGALPLDEAWDLAFQLAGALGHVHQHGLLHRDLKPDNLLCESPGGLTRWVLTDFGLAKDLEVEESKVLSQTGVVLGTPGFWAPEQAAGQESGPFTDVYGYGATLYAALTGTPPIHGVTFVEAIVATQNQAPIPPRKLRPEVSPELEAIVLRCLAKDPGERFPDGGALTSALAELERARVGASRRSPGALPLGVLGVLGVLLALGLTLFAAGSSTPGPPPPANRPEVTRPLRTSPAPVSAPSAAPSAAPTPTPAPPPEGRIPRLQWEAERGDPVAMRLLAKEYMAGLDVEQDLRRARELLEQAVAKGDPVARSTLVGLITRWAFPADPEADQRRAHELLEEGDARGDALVIRAKAHCYQDGLANYPVDLDAAHATYRRAAELGDTLAYYSWLSCLRPSQLPVQGPPILQAIRERHESGQDPIATMVLGLLHEAGFLVEQDMDLAGELLRAGAERSGWSGLTAGIYGTYLLRERGAEGHAEGYRMFVIAARDGKADSLHTLGLAHLLGTYGTPRDLPIAVRRFHCAARLGNANAMMLSSRALYAGWSGEPRIEESLRWGQLAAEKGQPEGYALVGLALYTGRGLPRDPQRAVQLLARARNYAQFEGRFGYALAQLEGRGLPANPSEALRELRLLAQQGHPPSLQLLGVLSREGRHLPRDEAASRAYLRQAVQAFRRTYTERGAGIPPPEKARAWLAEAFRVADARGQLDALLEIFNEG